MLENLVSELRSELRNKRPQTGGGAQTLDWEDERINLEMQLQKAQARIDALQNELTSTT